MKNIVIDARRIRETTGRYSRELLNELQKLDSTNQYHVIVHKNDAGSWEPSADNFMLHIVPYNHYTFSEQLGLARFIRSLKPDLVHFTMPQQPLLYFGKRVTTIHDLTLVRFKNLDKNPIVYWVEQTIFKGLLFNVARRSKHIITPSNYVRHDIANYAKIDPQKITVTYEAAFDHVTNAKTKLYKPLKTKQYIMYVGNAFPHKNLEKLCEAFILMKKEQPNLSLVFVGKQDFFYKKIQQYVNDYEIKDVIFTGYVDDAVLTWLYKNAQCYVYPSLSEGFGLPGLEAMQHKLAVLSSNATCLPEIYGDAAVYFDPNSAAEISKQVLMILNDPTRKKQLVVRGSEKVKEYSWAKTASQTLEVYTRALSQ